MANRLYILPADVQGNYRGPKYFKWRFNQLGLDVPWDYEDYGAQPLFLLMSDISQAQHDNLTLNADVYSFPADLNTNPKNAPELTSLIGLLEANNIPADHIQVSDLYKDMARVIAHTFKFNQRFNGIYGNETIFSGGRTLNTNIEDLPALMQQAFADTVLTYNQENGTEIQVSPTDSIKQTIRKMVAVFENSPISLLGVTL